MESAYGNVVHEYDSLLSDKSRSFMNNKDISQLAVLNAAFLDSLAHAAQMTADKLGIKDIRFEEAEEEFEEEMDSPTAALNDSAEETDFDLPFS